MAPRILFKVTFHNAGKVYEIYARRATASAALPGFTEVSDLVFDAREGVVVDPTEERLREEFADTRALHIPLHAVIRVEEVERKGTSAIRDAATGERVVMQFPLPGPR